MTNRFLGIALAIITMTTNAQNEIDALRYSTHNLNGTARYTAMGGAFSSLGAEFSALSQNPAGIGMYQFSELTFTPAFNLSVNKSYFNNSNLSAYKSAVAVSNLGIVFALPQNNSDWKRINLGVGWNQLASYENSIRIEGVNKESSIVDRIVEMSNGILTGELTNGAGNSYSQMAWNTYLIDPLFNNNGIIDGEYTSNFSLNPKSQSKNINSSGGMNEFIFSIGGSYKDKLYMGATVGIPTINYHEFSNYTERELSDTSNNLREMILSEEISAYGTGYNLKVGAIYRLTEKIKIGGSLHTPTFFTIEENYNTSITTFFKDSTLDYSMGYLTPFKYDLITPYKAIISASTIFNNILISAEYEIIDYGSAKYFSSDFENENLTIESKYQQTENIKIGAEFIIKPFVLRAGYSKYGSALASKDFSRENFSYGFGINNGVYFVDMSYIISQGSDERLLYSEDYLSPIKIINTNHSLVFTLGFRY